VNFLREHRIHVNSELIIPKYQLQKGMIVSGRYKSQEGGSSDYIILVLQPSYEKKLHGLSLKEVKPDVIQKLAAEVGTKLIYGNRFKRLEIPKLQMVGSSYNFYNSKLKNQMESEFNTSYRTFNLSGFTSLMLLDYNF
tara:strand:- start:17920 stop:18333 length:414 start_codon:yes stop_codon:yes gene_type:complete